VSLTSGEFNGQRQPFAIDDQVQLARKPAT
jgi:hypothetical protein